MKRALSLFLLIIFLVPFTGCDPLYFVIRFGNTGTTGIAVREVRIAPAGGAYGDNLLPVEKLHTGEYCVIENIDRWRDYDLKVVYDVWVADNQTYFSKEQKDNVPVAPPDDCVTWYAYCTQVEPSPAWGLGYSWGCFDEYDEYDLVGASRVTGEFSRE